MLTMEQKKMIKDCFDSREGFGLEAPAYFTCRCMKVTSGIKDLPFEEVWGYIEELETDMLDRWCKRQSYLAHKEEEEKKKNESKRSRGVSGNVRENSNEDDAQGNMRRSGVSARGKNGSNG